MKYLLAALIMLTGCTIEIDDCDIHCWKEQAEAWQKQANYWQDVAADSEEELRRCERSQTVWEDDDYDFDPDEDYIFDYDPDGGFE